ncbi:hypothetical protein PHMEG_0003412 [Phytophthora megakarya]|uniref:Uncharacterized protein n=1 Tax=Phytophthora megakarya TaxID=4795 RepID=A0A225WY11_9STRA|nr:hypothetical protein PHMEG_0003412 [Phytophthora megakarya]
MVQATLLFASGAEISIWILPLLVRPDALSTTAKSKSVGIGENAYTTEGRTQFKITLTVAYVYYFDAWGGERSDMVDGLLCLLDEVRIQLSGRRQLFSGNSRLITVGQNHKMLIAGSVEIAICSLRLTERKCGSPVENIPAYNKSVITISDATTRYSSWYLAGKRPRTAYASVRLDQVTERRGMVKLGIVNYH